MLKEVVDCRTLHEKIQETFMLLDTVRFALFESFEYSISIKLELLEHLFEIKRLNTKVYRVICCRGSLRFDTARR